MGYRLKSFKLTAAWIVFVAAVAISIISLFRSVDYLGKPFAGFLYGSNLVVGTAQRADWDGVKQGLHPLDKLLSVDGLPIRSGSELAEIVAAHKPGDTLIYKLKRYDLASNPSEIDVAVKISRYSMNDFIIVFLFPFLLGLLFIFFGGMLYFFDYAPRGRLLYFFICCLIGIVCTSFHEAYTSFLFFRVLLVYPIIAAFSLHLFLLFPESRLHRKPISIGLTAFYVLGVVLLVFKQLWMMPAQRSSALSKFSSAYILVSLCLSIYFLIRGYYETKNQAIHDKIKILGIGIFIAAVFLLSWSNSMLFSSKIFFLDEGILLAAVFPIFMGYAIVRNNIFQLDRFIRAGLSNGAAAIFVFSIYFIVINGIRYLFPQEQSSAMFRWFLVLFFFFLGFVFNYLRIKIKAWLQRFLFRSQYNAKEILFQLDRTLVAGIKTNELSSRVGTELLKTFDVSKVYVVFFSSKDPTQKTVRTYGSEINAGLDKNFSMFESEGFLLELAFRQKPFLLSTLDLEKPGFYLQSKAILKSHGVSLVVPILSSKKLLGVLLIGEKNSKENFDTSDLEFLSPLAQRMGIVLENSELTMEAENQSRLAELGQMASILIHDIKNPLSTINISAGTLKKRFKQSDPSFELATFIQEEVLRIDRTVQEILTYAKPVGVILKPCSVNAVIDKLAVATQPSFDKKGVSFEKSLDPNVANIAADENRLHRAFENLLINALEATNTGKKVSISSSLKKKSSGHSYVEVVIADEGKGIDPSSRENIFKPFFTTKPSGTGLGLAIVAQIMQEHSAKLDVESQPGLGTRFTLTFHVNS